MGFMQTVKKNTPQNIKDFYMTINIIKERMIIFRYDKRRFLKYNAGRASSRKMRAQIEGRLAFYSHSLEKGLSHQDIRLGFGKSPLKKLGKNMKVYVNEGYSKDREAFMNALSVLKCYVELHENARFDISYIRDCVPENLLELARGATITIGGVYKFDKNTKNDTRSINFKELFENRWSVREYSDLPVDMGKIDEVIEIARKTPSVCNRQPSRATIVKDKNKISSVLRLQGGLAGYELPPVLIVITTDTTSFVGVNERNQIYIDGGLYAMSVLLGLEYVGLAACSLNAMLMVKRDKAIRKVLNIPPSENIIMFISVGNFLPENKVPKSFRYSRSEVSRVV